MITYVVGGLDKRGTNALLTDGGLIFGTCSLAYAERVCEAMNRAHEPLAGTDALAALLHVIEEQNNMLVQHINSRERDPFTSKESDDSKRARQLLERAGQIVHGAV